MTNVSVTNNETQQSAEQDLLGALHSSKKTLGASIPRLITQKPQVAMSALKHGLTAQNIFMPPAELAQYLFLGMLTFEDLRPCGITEIQTVQRIIDTTCLLNRAISLQNNLFNCGVATESSAILEAHPDIDEQSLLINAECASYRNQCSDDFEKLRRYSTHLQRSLKEMKRDYLETSDRRMKKRGDQYETDSCPGYLWYAKLADLTERLIEARQELSEKLSEKLAEEITPVDASEESVSSTEQTENPTPLFRKTSIFLVESLTPQTAETFEEARANGLLTKDEADLFRQPAAA